MKKSTTFLNPLFYELHQPICITSPPFRIVAHLLFFGLPEKGEGRGFQAALLWGFPSLYLYLGILGFDKGFKYVLLLKYIV